MITFDSKKNIVTLCGQEFTLEYFQRVQLQILLDIGWSPEALVSWCENAEVPFGQAGRIARIFNVLEAKEEARKQAEKEAAEREYRAWYNSPEQVAERQRQAEALHKQRLEHSARIRGARSNRIDDYVGGGIVSAGEWS